MMSYEKTEAEHKAATEKAVREIKGKLWAFYLDVDHAYKWRMQYDSEDVVTIRTLHGHLAQALEDLGEEVDD